MGVPPSLMHLSASKQRAAIRRAMQRMANACDDKSGDVVNKDITAAGAILIDADASTITFDMSVYHLHQVTLGGNRTLAVANVAWQVNQRFAIRLVQDGTGSRTVTWWSGIKWGGGSPPTLTTTINKADWIGFVTTGNGAYDGMVIQQNI